MVFLTRVDAKGRAWRTALAVVCALVVILAGAAQVAHIHPAQAVSHADCSLCVAAHVTLHPGEQLEQAAPSVVATAVEPSTIELRKMSGSEFALFTRPPPASTGVPA